MYKRILFFCLLLLCIACKEEKKEASRVVCTYQGDALGVAILQTITLNAMDDELVSVSEEVAYTFDDVKRYQEDINLRKAAYQKQEKCPEELKNGKCTKNIDFTWEFKENKLSSKTVINIEKAIEDEEHLSIFEKFPKEDNYISLDKTKKALEKQAYTCKKKKK
ncbi:hypothetical protein M2475_001732 [Breznakia sp. PF5-3]|uniref:DUF1307 domain-containing protein n=1 Tax=unclassified Breznakia TaxID=2623764 RepID=UPI0024049E40|nr:MULTISPECIES: DUF1307 domain-containing protein [unclassified Breznakia]MDF9825254.1 hypothetical protein [Breznakia sp. PM6-1]MDF9836156.1 hypothetical protein [Breznakia sp. PF5-3]MDF9838157.1 hypothetical protein [Breznakia sp. PFB2-8]MDF9860143.1 hypothetical protein [Breznakia sp. PH5-24]